MRIPTKAFYLLVVSWLTGSLLGCVGPGAMRCTRTQYNIAIQDTSMEQLLLNLVRLRYREPMTFVEVGSLTAGVEFTVNPSLALAHDGSKGPGVTTSMSLGTAYSEKPTISYSPLQGTEFAKRILNDVDISTIGEILRSGWHIQQVMALAVDEVGGIWNDPRTQHDPYDEDCDFWKFRHLCHLLRELDMSHALTFSMDTLDDARITMGREDVEPYLKAQAAGLYSGFVPKIEATGASFIMRKKGVSALKISINNKDKTKEVDDLVELLGLNPELKSKDSFAIVLAPGPGKPAADLPVVDIKLRSFETIMYFLSQGIPVPESHRDFVKRHYYVPRLKDGRTNPLAETETPWAKDVGLIDVKCSSTAPSNPLVAVCYRGAWFYIDQTFSTCLDKDKKHPTEEDMVTSKDTLTLLSYIYSIQAGEVKSNAPVTTVQAN